MGAVAATAAQVPAVVAATSLASPAPVVEADDVYELFRRKTYALLVDDEVQAKIRADLVGKSAATRRQVLLGLLNALKKDGGGEGGPKTFALVVNVPRPA